MFVRKYKFSASTKLYAKHETPPIENVLLKINNVDEKSEIIKLAGGSCGD